MNIEEIDIFTTFIVTLRINVLEQCYQAECRESSSAVALRLELRFFLGNKMSILTKKLATTSYFFLQDIK